MATTLGSPDWGSSPTIPCRWTYDYYRSGANMVYRVYGYVNTNQATRYFGYYIDASVNIGGQTYSTRLKENSPSTWSNQYTFDTGWKTVSNKTSGTTSCSITLSTNAPRGATTWNYSLAVSAAGSDLTAAGGDLGTSLGITINRYSSSFTDTVTWTCGSYSGTLATKTSATSLTWTPSLDLANTNTTGGTVTVSFSISTYSGNTLVQTKSATGTYNIPASVIPTASLSVTDAMGYLATYGYYIQGQSKFSISTTGTGAYGSTITGYSVSADGSNYNTSSVTTPVIVSQGTLTITATVTDSRGRTSNPVTTTVSVAEYVMPKISSANVIRSDDQGNEDPTGHYGKLVFNAEVTALDNQNSAEYTLQYKRMDSQSYTSEPMTTYDGQYSVTGGSTLFLADDDSAYNIILTVADDFGTATYTGQIPVAYAIMNWRTQGDGMAVGGINTQAGLQVYMPTEHLDDVSIDGTTTVGGNIYNYGICASDWILETKNKIFLWRENVNETYAGIQKTCDFENEALILNGTATGDVYYGYTCYFNTNHGIDAIPYRGQEMTLSIFPSGQGVRGFLAIYTDTSGNYYDIANSVTDEYTFTVPNDAVIFRIGVYIPSGTTINNVAFQMMLQASSTTNKTYTDFAPTNRDMVGSLLVKKFTTSTSIAGGGNAAITNSFITTPKGYTMVGVVGLSTNNVNVVPVSFRPMWGSSWDFELRNVSGSSSPTTLDVWVLFARGGLAVLEQ